MTGRGSHDRRRTERAKQEEREIPTRPQPSVLNRTEHGPRGQGGFHAVLRAVSVRVNTQKVNVCLLMMPDVISARFTSNYMNKQSR